MPEYIKLQDVDKTELLEESKTFCMFPWTHLNATPTGDIYPCCSNDYSAPLGNARDMSLEQAINTDYMKELRLNMLAGKETKICDFCYNHEKASPHSFRKYSIDKFSNHFDDVIEKTHTDGTIDDFRMRYLDIRFSNICNFKCRSCGTEFSSQWAIEDRKTYNPDGPIIIHVDDSKGTVLEEIIDQVEHIDVAYFAGGEPMITDEHYVVLEELIRKGKTDTLLRYNTNASTVGYKKHDIFELWSHFDNIEVSCSIDSWGDRAELMRAGPNWGRVEENLKRFRNDDKIDFQINTVFSIMNYLTLPEFYDYMESKNIVSREHDWYHTLYLAVNPSYYCARAMPKPMKDKAAAAIRAKYNGRFCIDRISNSAVEFAAAEDTWDSVKDDFFHNTFRLDDIRGEDFFRTFPELQPLQDTYK
jgi:MoaA/NifB/PqqE/SkfB family radical SAM enzyme